VGDGIEESGFEAFPLALGFGFTDLFDGAGALHGYGDDGADGFESLAGKTSAGDAQAADGFDAETDREEVESVGGIGADFVAREGEFHLFFVDEGSAVAGAVELFFLRDEKFGGTGFEAIDDVVGNGVHELDDVAFAEEFLAEGVEAFDFAATAVGGVGFFANASGELATGDGGDEKREKSDPILGIGDGEGADGSEEKIVEEEHGSDGHGDGDDHSPHCGNC